MSGSAYVFSALLDMDRDGLPDAWEQQIIDADPSDEIDSLADVVPTDDFDGDGEDNLTEYLNGTDPTRVPPSAYLWAETSKLLASDGAAGDWFGSAVSISGELAVVGAFGGDEHGPATDSAYVFDPVSGSELHKLTAPDGMSWDIFGYAVALNESVAVMGRHGDANGGEFFEDMMGSAHVFDLNTGEELYKLTASDGAPYDLLGVSIAVSETVAVIGAMGDGDLGSRSGSAYVFDLNTGAEVRKLTASDGAADDQFGFSVAISGNLAVIGAWRDDDLGADSGSVYVFDLTTGHELYKLTASDGAEGDEFGTSVSISGNLAVIGAAGDDDHGDDLTPKNWTRDNWKSVC